MDTRHATDDLATLRRTLEELLERLVVAIEANDTGRTRAIWPEIDARLGVQLDAEEQLLIPPLSRWSEREARTILAEHQHIRGRMKELRTQIARSAASGETASAFVDELSAHERHEDALMNRWADERLGETGRATLMGLVANVVSTRLRL